jgi:hypothetical protein
MKGSISDTYLKQIARLALVAPLGMGSLVADEIEGNNCVQDECCPFFGGQGDPMNPSAFVPGYGQYGGIEVEGCCGNVDLFVSGDFIYWSPNRRFRGDIFKFLNNANNDILIFDEVGGYKPGFKVGLGVTLPCFDDWTFEVVYTRYHHSFTNTFNATGAETVSPFSIPLLALPFSSIRSTNAFHYDNVRLIAKRANYLSPCIILEPYFALRGFVHEIKINQALTLLPGFTVPGVVGQCFQEAKWRTWSADLCAGGYGYLLLPWGFRVVFEGEIGAGYFRATSNESTVVNNSNVNLGATVIHQTYLHHPWWVAVTGTAGGGLSWGAYFCCQKYHVDLKILYELETIWGPFQSENTIFFLEGTQYRGLTVHAQFDF